MKRRNFIASLLALPVVAKVAPEVLRQPETMFPQFDRHVHVFTAEDLQIYEVNPLVRDYIDMVAATYRQSLLPPLLPAAPLR